ncbi:MAG: hypothetical protein R3F35_10145 [Myxococcota bacterium]
MIARALAPRRAAGSTARSAGLLAAALIGLGAAQADAFVPKPERVLAAVAQANATSGRTQAFRLDLVMRIGERERIATGELVSHPSGLARLELRGRSGRVDRYLLSGPELLAAKDGAPLEHPQPMLQPVFLLQPSTLETLRVALETFGVDSRLIGLAPCGELDCYVLGDPALAVPELHPLASDALGLEGGAGDGREVADAEGAGDGRAGGRGLREVVPPSEPGRPVARLWVDTESLQIQRIDRISGESMQLGPTVRFERLMIPAWLEIVAPGEPAIRFDVERAVRVNAAPQAFNPSWLYSPIDPVEPAGPGTGVPRTSPAAAAAPASP